MTSEQRRNNILLKLQSSKAPISATSFANEYSVTRQIIVADVALLRASGYPIRAEHKGYVLENVSGETTKRVVVQHGTGELKDELYAIVDNGGKVKDVIVEHSIYGTITAELNLNSRYEVDVFLEKIKNTGANPLSLLTKGVHVHTIAIKDEKGFENILEKLAELKILVEYE